MERHLIRFSSHLGGGGGLSGAESRIGWRVPKNADHPEDAVAVNCIRYGYFIA